MLKSKRLRGLFFANDLLPASFSEVEHQIASYVFQPVDSSILLQYFKIKHLTILYHLITKDDSFPHIPSD